VRVLDVGTGPGFVASTAASRGALVTGADQSLAMVALARAAGIDAVAASVDALPFRDRSYDAVVGGYLLNHLPRPEAAVRELARVLRPGGRLALTVWDLPDANPALGLFGPVTAELGVVPTVPPGPDAGRFSRAAPMLALLSPLGQASVRHIAWEVDVEPGAWFNAVAASTPRTGAVLAAADDRQRHELRRRYVELVRHRFASSGGRRVRLPAAAVLGSVVLPSAEVRP
jgi:SAM-dependent methyltransferase